MFLNIKMARNLSRGLIRPILQSEKKMGVGISRDYTRVFFWPILILFQIFNIWFYIVDINFFTKFETNPNGKQTIAQIKLINIYSCERRS